MNGCERLSVYELFYEGPSALRKYMLMAVRGLTGTKFSSFFVPCILEN